MQQHHKVRGRGSSVSVCAHRPAGRMYSQLPLSSWTFWHIDQVYPVQILTPLQQAKMQVASYPWPTDSLAICGIVAEETRLAGQGGQVPVQEDFMALLTGLPDKSPFRALAAPMPVG